MIVTCPICHNGQTHPGHSTITVSKPGGATIVFKDVPADICDNCNEPYVSEEVSACLLEQARAATKAGVEVDVRSFAAA